MKINELKKLLKEAITHTEENLETLCNSDNPNIVAIFNDSSAKLEAYREVLDACNNNPMFLKIAGGN